MPVPASRTPSGPVIPMRAPVDQPREPLAPTAACAVRMAARMLPWELVEAARAARMERAAKARRPAEVERATRVAEEVPEPGGSVAAAPAVAAERQGTSA